MSSSSASVPRPRSRDNPVPPPPTTPLRPSSRSSLRASHHAHRRSLTSPTPHAHSSSVSATNVPAINALEPQFAELSDSMADLEANFMHLQLLHESLGRFNECFSGLLYGLEVRAFCVDFGEAPIKESYTNLKRGKYGSYQNNHEYSSTFQNHTSMDGTAGGGEGYVGNETTFLTTDTSFVENPAPSTISSKAPRSFVGEPTPTTPAPASRLRGGRGAGRGVGRGGAAAAAAAAGGVAGRGGAAAGGAGRGTGRGSGLPRGTSGIARGPGGGVARGRRGY